MEKKEFLPIGKIVGVHGLRGNIKVYSYAESLSAFQTGNVLLARSAKGGQREYSIKWAKPHTRAILLSLKEIDTRTQAETLIGCELYVEKASLPELENDAYYWFDIIGISVFTVEGEYIGRLASIIPTGSNDVYVVTDTDKDRPEEILIPALASVVISVDLERKIMQVDLPEGLR